MRLSSEGVGHLMKTRLVVILVVLGAGVVAGAAWRMGANPSSPVADTLRIRFTGESLGRLDACLCETTFAGGLTHRRNYLATQEDPYLLLDTGNAVAPGGTGIDGGADMLAVMRELGVAAMNLGESEVALGREGIQRLAALGVPFVSLNLATETGEAEPAWAGARHLVHEGHAVSVAGVVDPSFRAGRGLRIQPVGESLARWVEAERGEGRILCLLADLTLSEVQDVARDFPEITLILFRGRNDTHLPERVNRTWIASIYGSRYIAELELRRDAQGRPVVSGEPVELDGRFAGDADRGALLDGVSSEPAMLDFGTFTRGETRSVPLRLRNANPDPIRVGRVLSPCGCLPMTFPEVEIPAGGEAELEVTIHSADLSGEVGFDLFIELRGVTRGILKIPATATVKEAGS